MHKKMQKEKELMQYVKRLFLSLCLAISLCECEFHAETTVMARNTTIICLTLPHSYLHPWIYANFWN